jgi:hypothetical protein
LGATLMDLTIWYVDIWRGIWTQAELSR